MSHINSLWDIWTYLNIPNCNRFCDTCSLYFHFVVIWYMSSLIHPLCKQFLEKGNLISILGWFNSTLHCWPIPVRGLQVSTSGSLLPCRPCAPSNPGYFYQFQIALFERRVRRRTVWHLTNILICIFLKENLWLEEIKLKKHRASAGSTYGKINLWVSSLCCSCLRGFQIPHLQNHQIQGCYWVLNAIYLIHYMCFTTCVQI